MQMIALKSPVIRTILGLIFHHKGCSKYTDASSGHIILQDYASLFPPPVRLGDGVALSGSVKSQCEIHHIPFLQRQQV